MPNNADSATPSAAKPRLPGRESGQRVAKDVPRVHAWCGFDRCKTAVSIRGYAPDTPTKAGNEPRRGRFRKRNLKHAKECSIQQRRGFACGVCRWKRRFGCSRNSAVSAARFESGFRERDGQGQHWRGPHSHGGFLKMIVCESGGHANGLTYFIFRFLRRPLEGVW